MKKKKKRVKKLKLKSKKFYRNKHVKATKPSAFQQKEIQE